MDLLIEFDEYGLGDLIKNYFSEDFRKKYNLRWDKTFDIYRYITNNLPKDEKGNVIITFDNLIRLIEKLAPKDLSSDDNYILYDLKATFNKEEFIRLFYAFFGLDTPKKKIVEIYNTVKKEHILFTLYPFSDLLEDIKEIIKDE